MLREMIVINLNNGRPSLYVDPMMIEDHGGGLIKEDDARKLVIVSRGVGKHYRPVWSDDLSSPVVSCSICTRPVPLDEVSVVTDIERMVYPQFACATC